MKRYRWEPETKAMMILADNGQKLPLPHAFLHSGQYDCGNRTSAAHELAFSILSDSIRKRGSAGAVYRWSRAFAVEVIANKDPMIHWEISVEEINMWMAAKRARGSVKC